MKITDIRVKAKDGVISDIVDSAVNISIEAAVMLLDRLFIQKRMCDQQRNFLKKKLRVAMAI